MIRRYTFLIAVMMAATFMDSADLSAQGYVEGDLSLLAPAGRATSAARYYDDRVTPAITGDIPPPISYHAERGCASLLPTIAEGLRNTLNCLLPCRGSRPLAIGGPLLGRRGGLFSVRFYDGCGCGIPVPQCGCGIRVIEGHPVLPTPAGDIPQVNPPKPVPDSSVIYYSRPSSGGAVPASYLPQHLRDLNQGAVSTGGYRPIRQANYYRTSPIPNPLRP
jgi:hypothetical protein